MKRKFLLFGMCFLCCVSLLLISSPSQFAFGEAPGGQIACDGDACLPLCGTYYKTKYSGVYPYPIVCCKQECPLNEQGCQEKWHPNPE